MHTPPALNLVVLRVADLVVAQRFYAALGLAFERHRHGSGPEHLACELPGGAVFELYPRGERAPASAGARVGFAVPSVNAALVAVVEACDGKAGIVSGPADSPWGLRAVLADPDGHRIELVELPEPAG